MAALWKQIHLAQIHLLLALIAGRKAHKSGVLSIQLSQIIAVVLMGHLSFTAWSD